jgi:serine protease AprX
MTIRVKVFCCCFEVHRSKKTPSKNFTRIQRSSHLCYNLWMKIRWLMVVVLIAGSLLPFASSAAGGTRAEITPQVWQDTSGGQEIELLLNLRAQADVNAAAAAARNAGIDPAVGVVEALKKVAMESQAGLLADLQTNGIPYQAFWITNMVKVRGGQALALQWAARPEVGLIESNPSFQVNLEPGPPAAGPSPLGEPNSVSTIEWGISQINAPAVWNLGFTGQDVVVASGDTGIQWDHPALISQYRGWNGSSADHNYNWWDAIHAADGWGSTTPCVPDQTAPCDDYGQSHGTHTTGTMVGDDHAGNQIGVAPGAKWIGCRNMFHGVGKPSTYIECLQFFLAPWAQGSSAPYAGDPTLHANVINNSYSCPPSEGCAASSLSAIVTTLRAAGIFVAVSAGNEGYSGCSSVKNPPGLYANVFTVGATDSSNAIAGFSSRGPVTLDGSSWRKPDLSAPGNPVRSSIKPAGYGSMSGTSMAAPHVAGAVALLWSAYPQLKGNLATTEQLLKSSATPLKTNEGCGGDTPDSLPNNTYGYGLLNALAAIQQGTPRLFLPLIGKP